MAGKKYTLELTADELADVYLMGRGASYADRVRKLVDAAQADREDQELKLPWRWGGENGYAPQHVYFSGVRSNGGDFPAVAPSGRAARLMAAAPELLEAVKAAKRLLATGNGAHAPEATRLIERALRKVETGVPEE